MATSRALQIRATSKIGHALTFKRSTASKRSTQDSLTRYALNVRPVYEYFICSTSTAPKRSDQTGRKAQSRGSESGGHMCRSTIVANEEGALLKERHRLTQGCSSDALKTVERRKVLARTSNKYRLRSLLVAKMFTDCSETVCTPGFWAVAATGWMTA